LFLDNGYEKGDWSGLKFENQEIDDLVTSRNICYFNNTRNAINKLCNEHLAKGKESITIKNETKNMILYNGLKVVAIVSNRELNFFNSEEFVVECFNDDEVVLTSNNDNNLIYIEHNELVNYFDINYIGTTHRSQGDTYNGKVCLFDFNKIKSDKHIIYTACSRATKFENVVIARY
jgi:ATP-dependent exoDNAse (exonuclease V) alpha subunit